MDSNRFLRDSLLGDPSLRTSVAQGTRPPPVDPPRFSTASSCMGAGRPSFAESPPELAPASEQLQAPMFAFRGIGTAAGASRPSPNRGSPVFGQLGFGSVVPPDQYSAPGPAVLGTGGGNSLGLLGRGPPGAAAGGAGASSSSFSGTGQLAGTLLNGASGDNHQRATSSFLQPHAGLNAASQATGGGAWHGSAEGQQMQTSASSPLGAGIANQQHQQHAAAASQLQKHEHQVTDRSARDPGGGAGRGADGFPQRVQLARQLENAALELRARGLHRATQWCTDLALAMPDVGEADASMDVEGLGGAAVSSVPAAVQTTCGGSSSSTSAGILRASVSRTIFAAKSHFDLRQYLRAHALLAKIEPASALGPVGTFLKWYSLYLVGEARKEQEINEAEALNRPQVRNRELKKIAEHLQHARATQLGQACDAHCLYLLGIVLKGLERRSEAKKVLLESLKAFPWNWSAWVDYLGLALEDPASLSKGLVVDTGTNPAFPRHIFQADFYADYSAGISSPAGTADATSDAVFDLLFDGQHRGSPSSSPSGSSLSDSDMAMDGNLKTVTSSAQPHGAVKRGTADTAPDVGVRTTSTGWPRKFFRAAACLELQYNEEALELYHELLSIFPGSSYILSQIAVIEYNMKEYDCSLETFERMRALDPHKIETLDTYSNILYVKENGPALGHLAKQAVRGEKYTPEACCIIGNYFSLKAEHEKAVSYFHRALQLNRFFSPGYILMGHEFMELKNSALAVDAYKSALQLNKRDYRAWYGMGQTYELLNLYHYALYYYQQAMRLRPNDARMWNALAGCYEAMPNMRAQAIGCFERAYRCGDLENLALARLARLYAEEAETEDRAAEYYQLLLEQPAHTGVPQQLSLEAVEALRFLMQYCQRSGRIQECAEFARKLLDTAGPEREEAKLVLMEIQAK